MPKILFLNFLSKNAKRHRKKAMNRSKSRTVKLWQRRKGKEGTPSPKNFENCAFFRILHEDSNLQSLYLDLVVVGVMSSEQFWKDHGAHVNNILAP